MKPDNFDKATPRPWHVLLDQLSRERGYLVTDGPSGKWRDIVAEQLTRADAELIVAAVNAYNPERDRLARELAQYIWDRRCDALANKERPENERVAQMARQLLKMGEEE